MSFHIRPARIPDAGSIGKIFALRLSDELQDPRLRQTAYWKSTIEDTSPPHAVWVAEDDLGRIVGWQSLLPNRINPDLRECWAESSTYISPDCRSKGIGTALLTHALDYAVETDLQYLSAITDKTNTAMNHLNRKLGWKKVGHIPGIEKPPARPDIILWVYLCDKKPGQRVENSDL